MGKAIKTESSFKKIDSHTLEVSKREIQPEAVVAKYERKFIEEQIIAIQKQKDEFVAARDKEIQECNEILAQMDALNITVKP